MPNILQDFRYVLRLLLKSPGFTIFAILTLGVGIGANVLVFSVLNAVLVRPLPVREPERLVRLYSEWEPAWPFASASAPDFVDWRERNSSFKSLAATRVTTLTLQTKSRPERVLSAAVSANYFELIGALPSLGRGFMADEDQPGNSHVVIFSEGLCLRLFGSTTQALGRTV